MVNIHNLKGNIRLAWNDNLMKYSLKLSIKEIMLSELTKFETGATLVDSATVAALGSALYRLLRKLSCMFALFFAVVVLL